MSRRAILAIVAAVAVASAAIGWIAGQQIKSPADIAAEAEPPEASLITVPVEQQSLSSNVVIRGQVEFSESTDIDVAGPADGGVAIITRLTKQVGEQLDEGDVVIEVAGRPLFVFEGELPVFRSLTPGLEGPDVRQLEEALLRLGLDPGPVDGTFDAQTEDAIVELYREAGYSADEPSADDLERLEQARRSVRSAQSAVTQAEDDGATGVPESTKLRLNQAVAEAETALTLATTERTTAIDDAWAITEAARTALTEATTAAETAADRLAQAEAGTHPDTGVAPTEDELVTLRQERDTTAADLVAATDAEKAATEDEARIKIEQDGLVASAEASVEIAKAERTEGLAPVGGGEGNAESLRQARESLTDAQTALNRLESEVGVQFPASEIVFLAQVPSEVQALRVGIGDVPQGPVMTVTGAGVRITSSVSAADRSLLSEGVEAIMEDDDLGISVAATISFIADNPGGQDVSADRYAVRLEAADELPENAIGQNLRVTIPFASTDGEVLAVPLAALSAGADGSARVEVERADGSVEVVTVVPGLNARAAGLVEITPVDGELEAGDRVVVGRNQPSSSTDSDESEEGDSDESDGEEESDEGDDG